MLIGISGRRPQKTPAGFNENSQWKNERIELVKNEIVSREKSHINGIISGGAIGWDFWVAELAIDMNIPLLMYLPFEGQQDKWPPKIRERYWTLIENAKDTKYICSGKYANWKFHKRNQQIVNDCDQLWVLWEGNKEGGTYSTICLAAIARKPIYNFWGNNVERVNLTFDDHQPKNTK